MTNLDAAQVLEDAADLLLIKGRCTIIGQDLDGRYCVLGAIAEVQGRYVLGDFNEEPIYNDEDPAVIALANHVAHLVEGRGVRNDRRPSSRVYGWNDWLDLDDFEIIDTLRIVAKDLRNGA